MPDATEQGPPPAYLPPDIAEWLRSTLRHVSDAEFRGAIISLVEQSHARGYADGYERGWGDGAASVEALAVDALTREATPTVEQPAVPAGPATTDLTGWTPQGSHARPGG